VFFAPEAGGYFLENNNFIPADPLENPDAYRAGVVFHAVLLDPARHDGGVSWLWALVPGVVAFALLIIWSVKSTAARVAAGVTTIVLLLGLLALDAKVWGVVLMGTSVMIFFFLAVLDRSPVRSIRYKGPITKAAIALFVIAFFRARLPRHRVRDRGAHPCRADRHRRVFLFFLLMPWYSKMTNAGPNRRGHLEMKALVVLLALAAPLTLAAEESVRLDSAPIDPRDVASLQAGARTFVNYCLNCHSAGMMRYHKLLDLGLTSSRSKTTCSSRPTRSGS